MGEKLKREWLRMAVFRDGVYTREQWLIEPKYRRVKAERINRVFLMRQSDYSDQRFHLLHRPTGWLTAYCDSRQHAIHVARALMKLYPVKRWLFTNPMDAKQMKRCKPTILKLGANI